MKISKLLDVLRTMNLEELWMVQTLICIARSELNPDLIDRSYFVKRMNIMNEEQKTATYALVGIARELKGLNINNIINEQILDYCLREKEN